MRIRYNTLVHVVTELVDTNEDGVRGLVLTQAIVDADTLAIKL